MDADLRLGQLLCSRLCHDLVGAVGAVNAGLELAAEDPAAAAEAIGLSRGSADEIGRRLAFFRVAFGLGTGAEDGGYLAEARRLVEAYLQDAKVELRWPANDTAAVAVSPAGAKLFLNMVLIGVESLPRGGVLAPAFARLDEGLGIAITAAGDGARLSADTAAALAASGDGDALTARSVHAYLAQRLAETLGGRIECEADASGGRVQLAAIIADGG